MKLTPLVRLYGFGAILLAALAMCSRHFDSRGDPSFMMPLAVASAAYLLAIRELFTTAKFPKRVILFGLAVAAGWQLLFLRLPPGTDDDIHRYVWDGRVQRLGYNPYILVPNDPAHAGLHTAETRTMNNSYLPSPYPAGAELFFRAVTAIHESTFALKAAFVACDWAIAFVLLDILRWTGRGQHWVLAYAWHPLLAIEVAGSGHIDIVGVLLLVLSAAALVRRWHAAAAVAFALAVSVKFVPMVLLPLYWKRVRIRDAALAAAIFGLLYVPFLEHGRLSFGSLGTYVHSFWFNDPVFAAIERIADPRVAAGVALLAGFLSATWMRRRSAAWSSDTFAWPMAASLLCAPVLYPWYLLWILPFLDRLSTLPIMIWSVTILSTYYVWYLRALGRPWILPDWIIVLEYGTVAVVAGVLLWRRARRRADERIV